MDPTQKSNNGIAHKLTLPPQMPVTAAVLLGSLAKFITSLADDRAALAAGAEVAHDLQLIDGKWRLPGEKRMEFAVSELESTATGRRVYQVARDTEVGDGSERLLTIYARGKVGKNDELLAAPKQFEYFDVVRKLTYDWHDDHWRVSAAKGDVTRVDAEGTEIDDSATQRASLHGKYFKGWATHTIKDTDLPFPPELRVVEERNERFKVDWSIEDRDYHIYCVGGTTYCKKDDFDYHISIDNADLETLDHDEWKAMPYKLYLPKEKDESAEEEEDGASSSSSESEEVSECSKGSCNEIAFLDGLCAKHYKKRLRKEEGETPKKKKNKKSK